MVAMTIETQKKLGSKTANKPNLLTMREETISFLTMKDLWNASSKTSRNLFRT